jgi:hypothetical protein
MPVAALREARERQTKLASGRPVERDRHYPSQALRRGAQAPPTAGNGRSVVGVRQAKGLLGIGFGVNAAVLAAEKPRSAR